MIVAAHQRRLQSLLSQKPDLTLKELREAVELKCSLPAIHYALEAMGLTYKDTPSERTRPPRHRTGAQSVAPTTTGLGPARLIFIDESGAKTNLTRLRGRAQRGKRVHASTPHGHWHTTTMISSIRLDGSTTCMTVEGATDTEISGPMSSGSCARR
jgi:hypothetical protein